ncbi:MAG: transcription elongation factor GreA [bacterium]
MTQRIPMTPTGRDILRAELKQILEVERPQNVQDIEEARAHGDLSENAEYHAAKERQAYLDARMKEVKGRLSLAEVIDPKTLSGERVVFGATVTLEDAKTGDEVIYTIVGEDEADAKKGLISITSPLARALIGKEIDATVRFQAPGGMKVFELVDVSFGEEQD